MKNLPIILHVNYVEQGQDIDQMCRLASSWGYDGIEFRRRMAGMTHEQYLGEIARAAAKHKLAHVHFGGPAVDLMTSDAAARRKNVDDAIAFYRAAARQFRLTVCNIMAGPLIQSPAQNLEFDRNGSALATEAHWEQAVAGFKELGQLAGELKFRLAFETHMNYLHDLPEPSAKLVDRIGSPDVGINLDYGNMALFSKPIGLADAIKTLGPRIFMVHLKNYLQLPDTPYRHYLACGLGDGVINHREFLRLLKAQNFAGPIVLEAPRQGDREWFARQDLAYFNMVRDEVG